MRYYGITRIITHKTHSTSSYTTSLIPFYFNLALAVVNILPLGEKKHAAVLHYWLKISNFVNYEEV